MDEYFNLSNDETTTKEIQQWRHFCPSMLIKFPLSTLLPDSRNRERRLVTYNLDKFLFFLHTELKI